MLSSLRLTNEIFFDLKNVGIYCLIRLRYVLALKNNSRLQNIITFQMWENILQMHNYVYYDLIIILP